MTSFCWKKALREGKINNYGTDSKAFSAGGVKESERRLVYAFD
jgi:hypothetical protein